MKWIVPLLTLGIVASSAVLQADDPTSLTIEGYTAQLSYPMFGVSEPSPRARLLDSALFSRVSFNCRSQIFGSV